MALKPGCLVQPDLLVVSRAELRSREWARLRTLLLVTEVLSPGSSRDDRFTKAVEYQRRAVPLYRIVDADQHLVEQWQLVHQVHGLFQ